MTTLTCRRPRDLAGPLGALLLVTGLLLTGCAAGVTAPDATTPEGSSGLPAAAVMEPGSGEGVRADVPSPDRSVVVTAQVSLRVEDVAASSQRVRALVDQTGGLVQAADLTNTDGSSYATITARIPASRTSEFIAALAGVGSIESQSQQVSDVTAQQVDLDARISALSTSITRLTALMEQSGSVADLVAVETELSRRQADLDSLQAQRDYLQDQVAMSTITISLTPVVSTAVEVPGFVEALRNGWNAFVSLLAGALALAGFALPFLIAVALIAGLVLAIVRIWRRRRA